MMSTPCWPSGRWTSTFLTFLPLTKNGGESPIPDITFSTDDFPPTRWLFHLCAWVGGTVIMRSLQLKHRLWNFSASWRSTCKYGTLNQRSFSPKANRNCYNHAHCDTRFPRGSLISLCQNLSPDYTEVAVAQVWLALVDNMVELASSGFTYSPMICNFKSGELSPEHHVSNRFRNNTQNI